MNFIRKKSQTLMKIWNGAYNVYANQYIKFPNIFYSLHGIARIISCIASRRSSRSNNVTRTSIIVKKKDEKLRSNREGYSRPTIEALQSLLYRKSQKFISLAISLINRNEAKTLDRFATSRVSWLAKSTN